MLRTTTAFALMTLLPICSGAAAEGTPRQPAGKAARPHAAIGAADGTANGAAAKASAKATAKAHAVDPDAAAAALGTYPAKVDYVSNDAPFVVFDVSPRKLALGSDTATATAKDASLAFLATDVLSYVNVFVFATSAQNETNELPVRTACGSKTPGYYSCVVPLRAALAQLHPLHPLQPPPRSQPSQGGDGLVGFVGFVGMRIETEGLDGDRSTVRVTLPVQAVPLAPDAPSTPGRSGDGAKPGYRQALTFIVDRVNRPAVRR